jgi:hypothetical protein
MPHDIAGALLPHPCTLTPGSEISPKADAEIQWRYISVALSSRSPALGVTQQVWPLGSPDFPQDGSIETAHPATAALTFLGSYDTRWSDRGGIGLAVLGLGCHPVGGLAL